MESIVEERWPGGLFPRKAGGRGCAAGAGRRLHLRKENRSLAKTVVSSESEVSVSAVPSKLRVSERPSLRGGHEHQIERSQR